MDELEKLRIQINAVDENMAKYFEERMNVVSQITDYKIKNNIPTYNPEREKIMKENNSKFIKNEELKPYYLMFLDDCIAVSKKYQEDKRKK